MLQDDEHEQEPERRGWHDEEINRCQTAQMVSQECAPSLRRRHGMAHHVLRHSRLTDLDTQLEQLAMDPRRAPQGVLSAYAPNQVPDFLLVPLAAPVRAGVMSKTRMPGSPVG